MKNRNLNKTAGVGGAVGSGAGMPALISSLGKVSGLSGAGMTSGLAALGGGSMVGGILMVAAIPVVVGVSLYALAEALD